MTVLIIPRHLVFLKFIDIPSSDDSEIEKIVKLQVIKDIPHPEESLIIRYRNLGSFGDGVSSIMLAAVNKDNILEEIRKRERSGARVEKVRLHSELIYLHLLNKGIISCDRISFIIHVGRESSEVMIVNRGRIVFSRGFKNSERFMDEIDLSVTAYEKNRDSEGIDDVIVAYPSDVDMREAAPHIKEHFTSYVSFHEYSEDLSESGLTAQMDFFPKELNVKRSRLRRRQELFVTFSLAGFAVFLFFAFIFLKFHEKSAFAGMLSSKIDKMKSQIVRLDGYLQKTEIAEAHLKKGSVIAEILKETRLLIPSDIALSGIVYDGKDIILYSGKAENTTGLFKFVKKLEKIKHLARVEVKHATKNKAEGRELTYFEVQCRLNL